MAWSSSRAQHTPGVGFAVGFERALLALEAFGGSMTTVAAPCVYVANVSADQRGDVFAVSNELRAAGIHAEPTTRPFAQGPV